MVGGTVNQQQETLQLAPPSSSSTAAKEEDEILKRNTDCVYFLASPLTCKKGSECEYRHSDVARVNPRDCWYWLNGNCLNPKCAFRHPPLDGLLGSDVQTTKGPSAPAPHTTPYAMPKQAVACIFFQKGFCLKGHLCPFLHGPSNSVHNKPAPANPVTEPPKMAQQVTSHSHNHKPVESLPSQVKQPPLPTKNGIDKKIAPPSFSHHVSNNGRIVKGRDAEVFSREPSPGFDVLVDNEVTDSGHGYDVDHVDRDIYREHRDYDHYNERDADRLERRSYPRNDCENESDLRHRLSKQRRGSENGSRPYQETFSSRLRGRIKIPERSLSPTKENNSRVDRETGIERRQLSRYSPGRPLTLNQSRVRDRINDTNFAGPKRLSELKTVKAEHQTNDERFLGKRKYPKIEEDLSFEGPKSLSEILKRKRGVNDNNNNNNINDGAPSMNNEDGNKKKEAEMMAANKDEHNSLSVDLEAEKGKDLQANVDYVNDGEGEGGMNDEDAYLDEELEAYDENRDGEYEYEQMEGEEDYNLDEGEYVEEEGVGDEYGNEEGVVYS